MTHIEDEENEKDQLMFDRWLIWSRRNNNKTRMALNYSGIQG